MVDLYTNLQVWILDGIIIVVQGMVYKIGIRWYYLVALLYYW